MFRTLSLFAALTLTTLPALAADDKPKADAKADRPRIKVFPLKNVAPADAVQAFNTLIGPANVADHAPRATIPFDNVPPPLPGVPLPPPAPAPIGPQGAHFEVGEQPDEKKELPEEKPLQLPQVQPQPPQFVPPPPPPPVQQAQPAVPVGQAPVRALADPRTRSLIVRGTEKELQLAADLVAVLDTPDDKPLPAVKSLKAFRLQHLDPVDFVGMLQALDSNITYRMAPVGRVKMLLAIGSDEQMKELGDAVKELDIPTVTK